MSVIAGYGSSSRRSSLRHSRTSRSRSGASDGIDLVASQGTIAEQAQGDAVERAGLDRLVDLESAQPSPQFAGRIAGERQRHDVTRFGLAVLDPMGDPPGQDGRLAGAGGRPRSPAGRRRSRRRVAGRHRALPADDRRSSRHDTAEPTGAVSEPAIVVARGRLAVTTVALMPFPKKNLNANETIALDMHPHWWYFAEPAWSLLGSIVLGIIVLAEDRRRHGHPQGAGGARSHPPGGDGHLAGRPLPQVADDQFRHHVEPADLPPGHHRQERHRDPARTGQQRQLPPERCSSGCSVPATC